MKLKLRMFGLATVLIAYLGLDGSTAASPRAPLDFSRIKFLKVRPSREINFIAGIYLDLLFRAPSPGEVELLLPAVQKARASAARAILDSSEYRSHQVGDLYRAFLGREADLGAQNSFMSIFANGGGSEEIKREILNSDEYFQVRAQGNLLNFVNAVYQDLLGRDPGEFEVRLLTQGTSAPIPRSFIVQFVHSSFEYKGILISKEFSRFLGRTPGPTDINLLLPYLEQSAALESLQTAILGSPEYFGIKSSHFTERRPIRTFLGSFNLLPGNPDLDALKIKINWGDGRESKGQVVPDEDGKSIALFGDHTFRKPGKYRATIIIGAARQILSTSRTAIIIVGGLKNFVPFPSGNRQGVRVAAGDVNGDGIDDVIVASGPGAPPQIKVFDGLTGRVHHSFLAYDNGFRGGVFVAAGDVNGDGLADIITGADAGSGPHVKVFSGGDQGLLHSFFAYETSFLGGVTVAAGDVNGDGLVDIVTGTGPGAGPHIKVFSGQSGALHSSFFAYDTNFTGGVFVAAGDINGDGLAEIITGAGAGAGPHVKAFNGANLQLHASFFAYDASFIGGVRVAAGDVNSDGVLDIVTGAGPGAGPHVKVFDGRDSNLLSSFFAFGRNQNQGVFVAAGQPRGDAAQKVIVGSGLEGKPLIKIQ